MWIEIILIMMMIKIIIIIMAEKIGEDKIDDVSKHDCNAKSIYKVVIAVKHWRKLKICIQSMIYVC